MPNPKSKRKVHALPKPTFEKGDMFEQYDAIIERDGRFLITTNSYLRNDGALVMGRGAALQAKKRFPDLPYQAGRIVRDRCDHLGDYHCILQPHKQMPIGLLQVKRHYREIADIALVEASISHLMTYALHTKVREFHVNFPAIGFGGLPREVVLPLLDALPSNVHIWEFA